MVEYNHYKGSVGNNFKHVQITTKYRYCMMRKQKILTYCKVAIESVCENHSIKIEILNVQDNHVHMIVDCPRDISDSKLLQLLKGGSSFILFKLCPAIRKRYPRGHFWNGGYFCCSVGTNYDMVFDYIKNPDLHHPFH